MCLMTDDDPVLRNRVYLDEVLVVVNYIGSKNKKSKEA